MKRPGPPPGRDARRLRGRGRLYIAIGVTVTDWLLSFFTAVAYLLFVVWLVPTVVRRVL